jgi:hypothetical protein
MDLQNATGVAIQAAGNPPYNLPLAWTCLPCLSVISPNAEEVGKEQIGVSKGPFRWYCREKTYCCLPLFIWSSRSRWGYDAWLCDVPSTFTQPNHIIIQLPPIVPVGHAYSPLFHLLPSLETIICFLFSRCITFVMHVRYRLCLDT